MDVIRVFVDDIRKKFRNASQYQLEDVIDWFAYMEYLQSVLKKFDGVATPMDNLLIRYFRDNSRLSIRTPVDEKNRNQNDGQMVVKQAIDAVTKQRGKVSC